MKNTQTHKQSSKETVATGRQRSYGEIVEYLDARWSEEYKDNSLNTIKQLDKTYDHVSQKVDTILITGTNGKSLTAHFTAKLLQAENLSVGTLYAPHILTYNERISLNNESITNKLFTDLGNDVINTAELLNLNPHATDILTMMALLYFKNNTVDVVLLETHEDAQDPVFICKPKIVAVTRITGPSVKKDQNTQNKETEELISIALQTVQKDSYVISADQSKLNLQTMQAVATQRGGTWAMPIRKLAALAYPYEQLYGRCAALAERAASIYINTFANKKATLVTESLLTKTKGQRGRPTLDEKKRQLENPKETVDQFWKKTCSTLPARFQILDKEKPTILLDTASNLDAFENILLGIRLLHYQRSLKGLAIILGCANETLDMTEFVKLFRYFFKKTSGNVIVCPVSKLPGHRGTKSWDVEKVTNALKEMKIKATAAKNLDEAFDIAKQLVDERHGFMVIAGSPSIVTEYWRSKGIKKL
ncbi:MAG TPA: hypothetical protein VEK38_03685 [Candidatus Bathyarchaeia archaeon]|nr:hypothetical protein [Candidatus Bathyarchaeia archaeon]